MSETTEVNTPEERPAAAQTLYDLQIETFQAAIVDKGLNQAFKRHGFALFHSLPPADRLLREEEMGLCGKDALTQYNLGVAYAEAENFDKAIACWKRALKQDPEMATAEFNLAVANERLGKKPLARKHIERYKTLTENPDDLQIADEYLEELGR